MVLSHVAPGGPLPSSTVNALVDGVNQTALQGVVPASVAGSGVTVSANGSVTFNAAATVSVNGVFSGTFDNYRIVWNSPTRTAQNTLYLRLRQGGTDVTSATYNYNKGYDTGTARTVQQVTAATMAALDIAAGIGQTSDGYTDIFGPAKGTYTAGTGLCIVWGASTPYTITTGFYSSLSTASDGFTIFPSGGTITGVLRVYGYNNLT